MRCAASCGFADGNAISPLWAVAMLAMEMMAIALLLEMTWGATPPTRMLGGAALMMVTIRPQWQELLLRTPGRQHAAPESAVPMTQSFATLQLLWEPGGGGGTCAPAPA